MGGGGGRFGRQLLYMVTNSCPANSTNSTCIYLSLTTPLVTEQGESPLAVAVRERNLDVIKCLVKECNATVNGESLLLMVTMLLTN